MAAPRGLWSDFSYVVSSGYREKVLSSLATKPKLPSKLAQETDLRLVHVSRALHELADRGLVACLTPEAKARGRLYGLTPGGVALLEQLSDSTRYLVRSAKGTQGFVPKIRGSSVLRVIQYLRRTKGKDAAAAALKGWSVDADGLTDDTWISVDAIREFLDLIEADFGDGSYGFIRALFAESVASFPTIRAQLLQAVPLETLAERAPIVYHKEWNYGRLEVDVDRRRVSFQHFDWMPTPAMCALFHGVYDGVLKARHIPGKVTKKRCVRSGDACCEYLVEW